MLSFLVAVFRLFLHSASRLDFVALVFHFTDMAPTISRKGFTLSEKVDIIRKLERGISVASLAEDLGRPQQSIYTIKRKKDDIMAEWARGDRRGKSQKARKSQWPALDDALADWFKRARAAGITMSDAVIEEKAKQIAASLELADFNCSHGYVSRFKTRHQLSTRVVSGEGGAVVDDETITEWQREKLPDLIAQYHPKDVFNADETALFYRLLPHRTLAVRGDKCQGGKRKKERVSVLVGANMDGSEKPTPLVIGHFAKPRCFRNSPSLPVTYAHSKNAWMTSDIFRK